MKDIFDVRISPKAYRDLKKVPLNISLKLQAWIEAVGHQGLFEVRKISGYHDETLKGKRKKEGPTFYSFKYCLSGYLYNRKRDC